MDWPTRNRPIAPKLSSNNAENNPPTQNKKDKQPHHSFVPTLRKSSKGGHFLGQTYYSSMKEAVFEIPCKPFAPQDIPESLKHLDSILPDVHVCSYCKDCFRFASSLEEHTARRSWILGYWCQHCFQVMCVHVPNGKQMCSICISAQSCKRAYLRTKGMKKGQRAAVIRLFYNQCQFFAHLKYHNLTSVEINDLMLMPIPSDLKKEDHQKFDKACKALMEYCFVNRIHGMEFLGQKKVEGNWWDPPSTESNLVVSEVSDLAKIINSFSDTYLPEKIDDPSDKNTSVIKNSPVNRNIPVNTSNSTNTNSSANTSSSANTNSPTNEKSLALNQKNFNKVSTPVNRTSSGANKGSPVINKSRTANNKRIASNQSSSTPANNNLSVTYHHSSYRPPADIAFVDCGPTPSLRESNSSKWTPVNIAPKPSNEVEVLTKIKDFHGLHSGRFSQNIRETPGNSKNSPITSISTSIASSFSNKIYTMSSSNATTSTGPKISVKKFASDPATNWGQLGEKSDKPNNQSQPPNTKILTVHSEKCLDLSSIISQLPPDVINSKKIVFIEQNSNSQYQKNAPGKKSTIQIPSPTLSANCVKVVPQRRIAPKVKKPIPILPAGTLPELIQVTQPDFTKIVKPNTPVTSMNSMNSLKSSQPHFKVVGNQTLVKPFKNKISPSNFIYYNSRKKYVIKQANTAKLPSGPSNSILKFPSQGSKPVSYTLKAVSSKHIISEPTSVNPSSASPLTPSPSPSELSSSPSCDIQAKQATNSEDGFEKNLSTQTSKFYLSNLSLNKQKLLFIKHDSNGVSYLRMSKNAATVKNTRNYMTRYRQAMLDDFPHLSSEKIQQRIAHVKKLGEEYSNIMKVTDDKIILEQKRLISCLEDSIEQAKLLNINEDAENKNSRQIIDEFTAVEDWENQGELQQCPFCEKLKKPNNYLPGFSKLSANESQYCQCYNCHCSVCNTFQGSLSRFTSHINYHKQTSPHTCPECLKSFTSFDLLDKHTWMDCFHPLVKNWMLRCKICGIDGLTTFESLIRHFLIMHAEMGFACSDCLRVFYSKDECRDHQVKHQSSDQEKMAKDNQKNQSNSEKVSEPVEFIICKVGKCIVSKENFKNHLIDHVGVEEQIFYKCPFCPFSKFEDDGVRELFRDHLFSIHSHILPKYTNFKIFNEVQQLLKTKSNGEEVLPLIVNTRTIAQEAFEKGTQEEEESTDENSGIPMIVDVRSEAVDFNSANDTDLMPKILEVKSIANDSLLKDSDSIKKSFSTVIEISVSPGNIPSMEVNNGKVDEKGVSENLEGEKTLAEKENVEENYSIKRDAVINENSAEHPKENTTEENQFSTPTSALEDLKAKMSRTFKTLAKKIETTTMTLQECSKSLPKLKTLPEVSQIPENDLSMEVVESVNEGENKIESVRRLDENVIPDENVVPDEDLSRNIIQLPRLARIPQHLLNIKVKKTRKRKRREKIAFNGPLNYDEPVVEFKCHVCNTMIDSSWHVLNSHFSNWHQDEYTVSKLNPLLLKITSDYIEGGYKEVLIKKYKCELSPRKKRRRTRFATKIAEKVTSDQSAGICVTTESVEDDDGTFKCKKCDLRFSEIGDLREHIAKSHRIKGRYLVCLECGENFVVAPSLQMHLKAFHAIEDPLTYLLQNTAFAPENLEDTEEEEEEVTTEANQCYVCMAVFEDKSAVDKHLRVHGMAFLNRKRIEAKKNLNSPEKKFKAAVPRQEEARNGGEDIKSEKLQEEDKVKMTESSLADLQKSQMTVNIN